MFKFNNIQPSEDLKADWINTSPRYSNQPGAPIVRCGTNWDLALTRAYRSGLETGFQARQTATPTEAEPVEQAPHQVIRRWGLATGENRINMPENAKILTACAIRDWLCLYALVWSHVPTEQRVVRVYKASEPIRCLGGEYIASVVIQTSTYHVFDTTEHSN